MNRTELNTLLRAALEQVGADDHFGAADLVSETLTDEQCRDALGFLLPGHARQLANQQRQEEISATQARLAMGRPLQSRGRKLRVDTKIEPLYLRRAPFVGKVVGTLTAEDIQDIVALYKRQSDSNLAAAERWERILAALKPGQKVGDLPIATVVDALSSALDLAESA